MKTNELDDIINRSTDFYFVKYHDGTKSTVFAGRYEEKDLIIQMKPYLFRNVKDITKFKNYKKVFENSRFKKFTSFADTEYEITIIYPAHPEDVKKYVSGKSSRILETPKMYFENVYPKILDQDLTWINNILDGVMEQDDILYQDKDFVFMPDLKWDRRSVDTLYCLAIVKDTSLKSIRDLTDKDIPLLKHIYNQGLKTIKELYGKNEEDVRVYFHYHPSFWHLHIHFNLIQNSIIGASIDYAYPLIDVINNIKLVPDYYQKVTLEVLV